jgi:hypothetical protein
MKREKQTCRSRVDASVGPSIDKDKMLDVLYWVIGTEMIEFVNNLEAARTMWRRYRELVEAEEFPEPFRKVYAGLCDEEPHDDCAIAGEETYAVTLGRVSPDLLQRMDEVATTYSEESLQSVRAEGKEVHKLLEGVPILAA